MAAIDDLLTRIDDPALRTALTDEFAKTRSDQEFGLVFERHLPESVRLPGHPIRKGLTVEKAFLDGTEAPVAWTVRKVKGDTATIVRKSGKELLVEQHPVAELIVVRMFDEPIYPGLRSVKRVKRGGNKPFHVVVNAENYHALETLVYSYEGKVDCIYIDPPYNTGNDSWRYNDKYVDSNDAYRHSKWLAFMERRLVLARRLLAEDGLILLSIDDNQHARLKLLCDAVFGEDNFISSMIWKSKSGGANDSGLAVDHEYVLLYGKSANSIVRPDRLGAATTSYSRSDENGRYSLERLDKQNLSYSQSLDYDLVGPDGAVYKLKHKDSAHPNATWRWGRNTVADRMAELVFEKGHVYTKNYEKSEYVARSLLIEDRFGRTRTGGKDLAEAIGSAKQFDYPKPVKLLEHLIGIASDDEALVLDFFGGSGTTTEAVMRLNQRDGGTRRSIVVTNNEVSKSDAKKLAERGLVAGDPEWEAEGVFEKVALPRIAAATSGVHPNGDKYSEGYEENVEFFRLTYEDRDRVSLGAAFEAIAPLLWMRAGAIGPRVIKSEGAWALPANSRYGVLFDAAGWREFADAVNTSDLVTHAFIVTDSNSVFQQVVRELPPSVEPVRLYENYLDSFEINTGGTS